MAPSHTSSQDRLHALSQVVHTVLRTIENVGDAEPGSSSVNQNWGRLQSLIEGRILGDAGLPAASHPPSSEEFPESFPGASEDAGSPVEGSPVEGSPAEGSPVESVPSGPVDLRGLPDPDEVDAETDAARDASADSDADSDASVDSAAAGGTALDFFANIEQGASKNEEPTAEESDFQDAASATEQDFFKQIEAQKKKAARGTSPRTPAPSKSPPSAATGGIAASATPSKALPARASVHSSGQPIANAGNAPRDASSPAGRSDDEKLIDELKQKVFELQEKARTLRSQARASGGGGGGGDGTSNLAAYLDALGVGELEGAPENIEDGFVELLSAIRVYFDGTERNLQQAYNDIVNVSLRIPALHQAAAATLAGSEDAAAHLESLRNAWKSLFTGIWAHLETWCEKLEESLDPEKIESRVGRSPKKCWQAYKDLIRVLSPHSDITESIRVSIVDAMHKPDYGVDARWRDNF